MNFLEWFWGTGMTTALGWIRQGVSFGLNLFNSLFSTFSNWGRENVGLLARTARRVWEAAQAASQLEGQETVNPAEIPTDPTLPVDANLGETVRVRFEVRIQFEQNQPPTTRSFARNFAGNPTGDELADAVLDFLIQQLGMYGDTPDSRGRGDEPDVLPPDEALVSWRVIDIRQR